MMRRRAYQSECDNAHKAALDIGTGPIDARRRVHFLRCQGPFALIGHKQVTARRLL